ncbi:HIT family protein [Marine Group I thaumarchaeote]|uniref:HIT family protein n=1 Tax=Marine Group I thaumarchaeote TaxID=2511932 RepID=A0A7K4N006_9ARCH|nr:HIT family protein [Marine Group I thaumarchaeote]
MSKCIFCDMIEGKLSCHMIYQDDDCISILDKYPIDNGHSLVITKKPYEKIMDMDVDEVAKLFSKIPKIAKAIIRATNADAFTIAQNNGKAAKQIVPHVHVHIIPRYNTTETLWTKRKILTENELDELAQKIKNYLE